MTSPARNEWWRSATIYQIYPRSFADSTGNGTGDLPGITSHLSDVKDLGIDAIWLSPFQTSPQKDAGYDVANYCDVDPLFGTMADFDALLSRAHELSLRVVIDLVPNHSSDVHPLFQAALAAAPGSPERAMYMFRDGAGPSGDVPPNNWESVFGGPAWTRTTNPDGTPGQWYLHLFDSSQPDFDWTNPRVHDFFLDVLRFWLDKGVDGFRVDVAHGLTKDPTLPDFRRDAQYWATPADQRPPCPFFGHDGVHPIYRQWRALIDSYPGDRILCAEAFVEPLTKMADWVRSDEMHQAFNFPFLVTRWEGEKVRKVIDDSLEAFGAAGAPSTWVLSNHDQIRHATRLAIDPRSYSGDRITGIGPKTEPKPDPILGLRRARAASAMMLALPGCAYIYNGEELGLPEATDIPDEFRQDPTFARTNGESYGRDGCRVPLPWVADAPAFGFNDTGATWLPQPRNYAEFARASQVGVSDSTLELYKRALRLRRELDLGNGELVWVDGFGVDVLAFANGPLTVIANYSDRAVALQAGEILLDSATANERAASERSLAPATTVWIRSN